MIKWQDNKKAHEDYWGSLYSHLKSQSNQFDNLQEEWFNLYDYENVGQEVFDYFLNGHAVRTNDKQKYCTDRTESLEKRINKYLLPTTDLIVDLGSGWGRHSISLSQNNPEHNIAAGELSEAGQNISKHFISKYDLKIESFSFNWQDHQSLIDLLSRSNYKDVILFSVNTIEQIPYINIDLFIDLINLPIDRINMIHIEPVNFQYKHEPFPHTGAPHYNRNLKSVLDSLENSKKIKVNKTFPLYWGHSTSPAGKNNILIEWQKT
jgi:hypothetical protein